MGAWLVAVGVRSARLRPGISFLRCSHVEPKLERTLGSVLLKNLVDEVPYRTRPVDRVPAIMLRISTRRNLLLRCTNDSVVVVPRAPNLVRYYQTLPLARLSLLRWQSPTSTDRIPYPSSIGLRSTSASVPHFTSFLLACGFSFLFLCICHKHASTTVGYLTTVETNNGHARRPCLSQRLIFFSNALKLPFFSRLTLI